MSEDYYKTLGINRGASESDIQDAYRELARKYHPDLNPDDANAKAQFQNVQRAYDVLNDSEKRELYDRYGSSFESMSGTPGGGAGRAAGFEEFDFGDLFGQRFGEGSAGRGGFADIFQQFPQGGGRGRRGRSRPTGGADIQHEVTVSFNQAISGGEANLTVVRGGGKTELITVKIPAGIEDGKKIRLRGQGEKSGNQGGPGDILITVKVQPHAYFQRRGNHLEVRVPITLPEAVSGAKVDVPGPGGIITLTVPPGTSCGTKLRVKGHGVPDAKGKKGDLYAELHIVLPDQVSDEDREFLQQWEQRYAQDVRLDLRW